MVDSRKGKGSKKGKGAGLVKPGIADSGHKKCEQCGELDWPSGGPKKNVADVVCVCVCYCMGCGKKAWKDKEGSYNCVCGETW